jgi:hypothetical protein
LPGDFSHRSEASSFAGKDDPDAHNAAQAVVIHGAVAAHRPLGAHGHRFFGILLFIWDLYLVPALASSVSSCLPASGRRVNFPVLDRWQLICADGRGLGEVTSVLSTIVERPAGAGAFPFIRPSLRDAA